MLRRWLSSARDGQSEHGRHRGARKRCTRGSGGGCGGGDGATLEATTLAATTGGSARHLGGGHATTSTPSAGSSRAAARCEQPTDGPNPPVAAAAPVSRPPLFTPPCSALSPLPARVAYRLPHLFVSRVAFASARAQPPSHADDRPVGPPSGPNACRAVAERQSRGRRARPDRSDSPACSRSSRAA